MLNRERYPLFQIISDDFINHNKLPVLLLLGIVFTAIGTGLGYSSNALINGRTRAIYSGKSQIG